MQLPAITISAPASARRPGPTEGVGGGPYVDDDEVGTPPSAPPALGAGHYDPPTGVQLTEPAAEGGPWHFAAIGDYGSGGVDQTRVAAQLLKRKPDMVVTLGDNVYGFGLEFEYRKRWDPLNRFGAIRSTIPVLPSLGNHDVRLTPRAYFKRFPELQGARYYTYERGGVRFVSLDSNQSLAAGSTQRAWLDGVLADSQDSAYRVLYMHHPLRSSQPRTGDALLKDLAPTLQAGHVDLVLSGHEHHYERSKPVNEYGTVHVTHGGGGKELHPFLTEPAEWSAARAVEHGFLDFEVRADALVGRSINEDGVVVDEFRVPRGGIAAAQGARVGAALLAHP